MGILVNGQDGWWVDVLVIDKLTGMWVYWSMDRMVGGLMYW